MIRNCRCKYKGKNVKAKCAVCEEVFIKKGFTHKLCSGQCREQWKEWYYFTSNTIRFWSLRFKVLTRDEFTCQYCGKTPQDGVKLEVDHIYPESKGGKWELDNLITSCEICNNGKTDVVLSERLRRKLIERLKGQNKIGDIE